MTEDRLAPTATYKDATPYYPPITKGRVIKVYDGDTITIATRVPNDETIYRFQVRIAGIDTPEIKGSTPVEKAKALVAKDALKAHLLGKVVTFPSVEYDKYGRILSDVQCEDADIPSIGQWMIKHGYAKAYDGGTKEGW